MFFYLSTNFRKTLAIKSRYGLIFQFSANKSIISLLLNRYQNVFRFLILRIYSCGEFGRVADALTDIMTENVKPDYPFCLDLIADTEQNKDIVEMMSLAVASHSSFRVDEVMHLKALLEALDYAQNETTKRTNDLNIGQTKFLALNIRKSHDDFKLLDDDIFEKLNKIKYVLF